MSDTILVDISGGIARVTFNRPAFLNAMDFEMGTRWRDVAAEVTESPEVGAIVLAANGPAFCAGGDVIAMATGGSGGDDVTQMAGVIHEGIAKFVSSDKPIVAAVNGAVAGGGLGLMLVADYIVASESSKFVSRYANIGLTPDLGVSTLLPAAIGQSRALRMLLQDITISAATAEQWGLVAEVVSAEAVDTRAEEVAQFWIDNATAAFGQAKRLIRTGAGRSFAENLVDEADTIGRSFDTEEAQHRVAQFAAASKKSR